MHEDPTRMMRQPDEHKPHGNVRLLIAGLVAVIVGLIVAVVVIASSGGSDTTVDDDSQRNELDDRDDHRVDNHWNDDGLDHHRNDPDNPDDDNDDQFHPDDHDAAERRRKRQRWHRRSLTRSSFPPPCGCKDDRDDSWPTFDPRPAHADPHRLLRGRSRRGAARPAALLRRPGHERDAEVDPGLLRRRGRLPHRQPRSARRGLRGDRGQGEAAGRSRVPRRRRPRASSPPSTSFRRSRPTPSTAAATRSSPRSAGR